MAKAFLIWAGTAGRPASGAAEYRTPSFIGFAAHDGEGDHTVTLPIYAREKNVLLLLPPEEHRAEQDDVHHREEGNENTKRQVGLLGG